MASNPCRSSPSSSCLPFVKHNNNNNFYYYCKFHWFFVVLTTVNINLLALDFDQTIMGIHTGGNWKETAETLIPHVRPMFRTIVPSALDRGLYVAVVTFSTQVDMVRSVLEAIVGQERAQSIPIRGGGSGVVGGNGSMALKDAWIYHGQGSHGGKQAHMASAVEELEQRHDGLEIHKTTTVLIDDDGKNIRTALKQGVRAVWLNPRRPGQILKDLVELI